MRKKIENSEMLPLPLPNGVKPEQVLKKIHSVEGKTAEFITNWAGSMTFVYFHVAWFAIWFVVNDRQFANKYFRPFDPFPYGLLTMIVSLEAIFLSTFILINQNRQALVDTYRELEEQEEEKEEDQEQEELSEDVEDIQQDLDDIKNAIAFIQQKVNSLEGTTPNSPKK